MRMCLLARATDHKTIGSGPERRITDGRIFFEDPDSEKTRSAHIVGVHRFPAWNFSHNLVMIRWFINSKSVYCSSAALFHTPPRYGRRWTMGYASHTLGYRRETDMQKTILRTLQRALRRQSIIGFSVRLDRLSAHGATDLGQLRIFPIAHRTFSSYIDGAHIARKCHSSGAKSSLTPVSEFPRSGLPLSH